MEEHHVLDVLMQGQVRVSATQLLTALRSLAPRLYSISSSPKAHPGEVHLTVDVLRYSLHNTQRKGVASNFLAELEAGDHVSVYVQPTKDFTLCDESAPIIMIGPGTGIAPFRAMLEEREATKARGQSWLFFGAQRQSMDFLYQEQLNAWVQSGRLRQLDCAWSRDQDYKVYVQDLMYHHAPGIWQWLEAGAYVYVCGDAKRMAKDVHQTLLRIISEQGRMSAQDAEEYMRRFKAEKRYRRDVY
jgi:sulfite reductase (NADPH) flavoprotein alpha-component